MKVTKVYKEDDCILVEVSGWPEALILPNHVDNRRFMKEFDRYESNMHQESVTGLKHGCTVAELKSIGFKITEYNGYQYMEKNCTIIPRKPQIDLQWKESPSGKYYTHLQCDARVNGLHPALTYNKSCILNEKCYDQNSDIHYGEAYSGVCKAIINAYSEGITDDCRLAHVCYTMFMNTYDTCDTCAQAEEWFKLIEDEEVTN